ncbi:Uncharacterised protein [Chromobacterium violaceum]|uniref:Uncharacterized protein n=1 Tax=Chromobacterium violaceum TaxID=536 RepID=A0A3S4HML3_CHRVL|nr:Uncharacterised protein [Chromobacterium violaceum]
MARQVGHRPAGAGPRARAEPAQAEEKPAPLEAPRSLALPLKVRVGELSLASLTLEPAHVSLYRLQAGYDYDGARHRLKLQRLDTPWGGVNAGLELAAASPFPLSGQLAAQGELEQVAVKARLKLAGDLLKPAFSGQMDGKGVSVELSGALRRSTPIPSTGWRGWMPASATSIRSP